MAKSSVISNLLVFGESLPVLRQIRQVDHTNQVGRLT